MGSFNAGLAIFMGCFEEPGVAVSFKGELESGAGLLFCGSPLIEPFLKNASFIVGIADGHIDDLDEFSTEFFDRPNACGIVQVDGDSDFIH